MACRGPWGKTAVENSEICDHQSILGRPQSKLRTDRRIRTQAAFQCTEEANYIAPERSAVVLGAKLPLKTWKSQSPQISRAFLDGPKANFKKTAELEPKLLSNALRKPIVERHCGLPWSLGQDCR